MEAPIWRHRGTNGGYWNSVTFVVFAAVDKSVVVGCVAAVAVT